MRPISILILIISFICIGILACKKDAKLPPIDNQKDLDGNVINDSSLINPANYLVSVAIPSPDSAQKATPVIIAIHGYSATTFEWKEFNDYAKMGYNVLVSRVLLGGHGRDYADFKQATWEDWQAPILDEYNKLVALGYKKIHILASSTGCPLVLNALRNKKINGFALKSLTFIDPLIIPGNKQISLIPAVSKVTDYVEGEIEKGEGGYWYKYRPVESLKQLEIFQRQERKALEKGYTLQPGLKLTVYKSLHDGAVDPLSAVQIQKGIKLSDGEAVNIQMVESNLHVFTRLAGRNTTTPADLAIQNITFQNILNAL
jgi:carboxylesterase